MKGFAIGVFIAIIVMIIMNITQDLSYIPQFTEEECETIMIEEGIE